MVVRGKGEFDDPLPANLGAKFPNAGIVDLRSHSKFVAYIPFWQKTENELLKILAPLWGIPEEKIPIFNEEEKKKAQKKSLTTIAIILVLLAVLVSAGIFAWFQNQQRKTAETTAYIRQVEQLATVAGKKHPEHRVLLLLEALRRNEGDIANSASLEQNLRESLQFFYKSFPLRHKNITAKAVSPDNQWVATGGKDGDIKLWRLEDENQKQALLKSHTGEIQMLSFSHDSRLLASSCLDESYYVGFKPDGAVRLWNLAKPDAPTSTLTGDGSEVDSFTFSPAGNQIAVLFNSGFLKIWLLGQDGQLLDSITPLDTTRIIRRIAYSPENSWFAAGCNDGTVRLWKTDLLFLRGRAVTLGGHDNKFIDLLRFSPNGRLLFTTSSPDGKAPKITSNTARLWDLKKASSIRSTPLFLRCTFHGVFDAKFSNDSNWLFARAEVDNLGKKKSICHEMPS